MIAADGVIDRHTDIAAGTRVCFIVVEPDPGRDDRPQRARATGQQRRGAASRPRSRPTVSGRGHPRPVGQPARQRRPRRRRGGHLDRQRGRRPDAARTSTARRCARWSSVRPWMLKCNRDELLGLVLRPAADRRPICDRHRARPLAAIATEMLELRGRGIEVVVVTLGAAGCPCWLTRRASATPPCPGSRSSTRPARATCCWPAWPSASSAGWSPRRGARARSCLRHGRRHLPAAGAAPGLRRRRLDASASGWSRWSRGVITLGVDVGHDAHQGPRPGRGQPVGPSPWRRPRRPSGATRTGEAHRPARGPRDGHRPARGGEPRPSARARRAWRPCLLRQRRRGGRAARRRPSAVARRHRLVRPARHGRGGSLPGRSRREPPPHAGRAARRHVLALQAPLAADHQPADLARASSWTDLGDFVLLGLGGDLVMDWSHASRAGAFDSRPVPGTTTPSRPPASTWPSRRSSLRARSSGPWRPTSPGARACLQACAS